jgi:hypothetical protein
MGLIWTGFAEQPRLDGYEELKAHADQAGTWERWHRKALDFLREDMAREKKEAKGSNLSRPVDHSRLVEILLWEGNVEDAWREAKEAVAPIGCGSISPPGGKRIIPNTHSPPTRTGSNRSLTKPTTKPTRGLTSCY